MNYSVRTTDFCNLDCEYCYAKTDTPHSMTIDTLEKVMKSIVDFHGASKESITINWTGGEPMLQGIKFFERVVEIQKDLFFDIEFVNVMQTNLTLINTEWMQFFKENDFQIRTSLDLPIENHGRLSIKNYAKIFSLEFRNFIVWI